MLQDTDKEAEIWEEGRGRDWPVRQGVSESLRITAASSSGTLRCSILGGIVRAGQSKYPVHSPHCCLDIPGDWEDLPTLVLSWPGTMTAVLEAFLQIPTPPGYGFIILHAVRLTNNYQAYESGGCSRTDTKYDNCSVSRTRYRCYYSVRSIISFSNEIIPDRPVGQAFVFSSAQFDQENPSAPRSIQAHHVHVLVQHTHHPDPRN